MEPTLATLSLQNFFVQSDILQFVFLINTRSGCKYLNEFEQFIQTEKLLDESLYMITKRDLLRFVHDLLQNRPQQRLPSVVQNHLMEIAPIWREHAQNKLEVPLNVYAQTVKLKLLDILLSPKYVPVTVDEVQPTVDHKKKKSKKEKKAKPKKEKKPKGKNKKKANKTIEAPPIDLQPVQERQIRYVIISGFNDPALVMELIHLQIPIAMVIEIWQNEARDWGPDVISITYSPSDSSDSYETLVKQLTTVTDVKWHHLVFIQHSKMQLLGEDAPPRIAPETLTRYNRVLDMCPYECVTIAHVLDALIEEISMYVDEDCFIVGKTESCICTVHPNYTDRCRCSCQLRNQMALNTSPFIVHDEDALEMLAYSYGPIGKTLQEKTLNYLKNLTTRMNFERCCGAKKCPDRSEILSCTVIRNPAKLYDILYLSMFDAEAPGVLRTYRWKEDLQKSVIFQLIPRFYNEYSAFSVRYSPEGNMYLLRFHHRFDECGICVVQPSTEGAVHTLICLRDFHRYLYWNMLEAEQRTEELLKQVRELELSLDLLVPSSQVPDAAADLSVPMNTARTDNGTTPDLVNIIVNVVEKTKKKDKGNKKKKKNDKKGKKKTKSKPQIPEVPPVKVPSLDPLTKKRLQDQQDLLNYPNTADLLTWSNTKANDVFPIYDLGNNRIQLVGSKVIFQSLDNVRITVDHTRLITDDCTQRFTLQLSTANRNTLFLNSTKYLDEQFGFHFVLNCGITVVFTKAQDQYHHLTDENNTDMEPVPLLPIGFRNRSVHTISNFRSTSLIDTLVMDTVRQIVPKPLLNENDVPPPPQCNRTNAVPPIWYQLQINLPNGSGAKIYTEPDNIIPTVEQQLPNGEIRIFRPIGEVVVRKLDGSIQIQRPNGDLVDLEQPFCTEENFLRLYEQRKIFGSPILANFAGLPFWYKAIQPFEGRKSSQKGEADQQLGRSVDFIEIAYDFNTDERFFQRLDGVSALYHDLERGELNVQFMDGARITSWFVVEDELVTIDAELDDGWVSVLIERTFQHTNYAGVHFDARQKYTRIEYADFSVLCWPDGTFTLSEPGPIEFHISPREIRITNECSKCGQGFKGVLNVDSYYQGLSGTSGFLLEACDSYEKKFTVDFCGNYRINENFIRGPLNTKGCDHARHVKTQELLLLKPDFSGATLLWAEGHLESISKSKQRSDHNDKMVLVQNHYQNYQNRFIKPLSGGTTLALSKNRTNSSPAKHIFYTTQRNLQRLNLKVAKILTQFLQISGPDLSPELKHLFESALVQTENLDLDFESNNKSAGEVDEDEDVKDLEHLMVQQEELRRKQEEEEEHKKRFNEKIKSLVCKQMECERYMDFLKKSEYGSYFESEFYRENCQNEQPDTVEPEPLENQSSATEQIVLELIQM